MSLLAGLRWARVGGDGQPEEVSNLASITITENHQGALRDGFITLYGVDNVEQHFYVRGATSVSGSGAIHTLSRAQGTNAGVLVIAVDADDTEIDTITIDPVYHIRIDGSSDDFYRYRNEALNFLLEDGHPPLHDGDEEPTAPGEPAGIATLPDGLRPRRSRAGDRRNRSGGRTGRGARRTLRRRQGGDFRE